MRRLVAPDLVLVYAFLVLMGVVTLIPFYWLAISSFKPASDIVSDPSLIPARLTLENYVYALTETPVPRFLLNTAVIAVGTLLIGLPVTSMAAFAFARYHFRGRDVLFGLLLASLAIPDYVTLIPSFVVARLLGLVNTPFAVIIPLAAAVLPLFLLRQYLKQLPEELFDAARIDGAGEFRLYWQIALPLIRPGLGAAGLLMFLTAWNAYLLPLVMVRTRDNLPISLGLQYFYSSVAAASGTDRSVWGPITVGATLSVVPLIVCLILMQRQFIAGLTSGAVKQ
ncbi:MAG: sugar ABC transporter permease [Dehalococcoidia bacterium]|nr:MAG: sugar ABC transporter permease [Dehalococcoidia bacterium]